MLFTVVLLVGLAWALGAWGPRVGQEAVCAAVPCQPDRGDKPRSGRRLRPAACRPQSHRSLNSAPGFSSRNTSLLDDAINVARKNSIHYLLFGLACCADRADADGGPRGRHWIAFAAIFRPAHAGLI